MLQCSFVWFVEYIQLSFLGTHIYALNFDIKLEMK